MGKAADYIQWKKGNAYFRRRVPLEIVHIVGATEWYKALKTQDSRVAAQRAKALEADTDDAITRAYAKLNNVPMAAQEIDAFGSTHFERTNAYLDGLIDGIDRSTAAYLKRETARGTRPASIEAAIAMLDPDDALEPDPEFLRRAAKLRLGTLLKCFDAGDYSLVQTFADDAFERDGHAQRISEPEDADSPAGPRVEWLEIDRSRADYQSLARDLMLREIEATKRSLMQIQKAEIGWIDAPQQIIAQVPNTAALIELAPDASKTPTQLLNRFKKDSVGVRGASTIQSVTACLERLEQVTRKKPISAITRNDVMAWYEQFSNCPSTRLKGETMAAAIARNSNGTLQTNSPATVRKDISHLRRYFEWALKRNLTTANPVGKLSVEQPRAVLANKQSSKAFSVAELNAIFQLSPFTTPEDHRPYRFWVPLICLFAGTRISEPCRLLLTDVHSEDGLHWLHIWNPKGKRHYNCPIHPELIRLGFLDFVKRQRAKGETMLFPDAPIGAEGRREYAPVVQWWGHVLTNADMKREGVNTHGFRHAFATACRNSGISKENAMTLMDHAGEDVHDGYGDRAEMERRTIEMRRLVFKGLDLSHLYPAS